MPTPPAQVTPSVAQTSSLGASLLGCLLLGYAFACLALVIYLSEHPQAVPRAPEPVAIRTLPDFGAIKNTQQKKAAFFNYLRPVIDAQNQQMRQARKQLLALQSQLTTNKPLKQSEVQYLNRLAQEFKLQPARPGQLIANLLVRADELPASMVLAQAALESAWGTSRFAREANNLFGQWCFKNGCGLIPKRRAGDASHEVKKFNNIDETIAAYFLNINTHSAYKDVRIIRAQARIENKPLRGMELAAGLEKYSERGQEYIEELRSMIRSNRLESK